MIHDHGPTTPNGKPANARTIERLAELLRRDLKLSGGATIEAHTPLRGGEHDLDSLDVLLLITSVEKEFGIKITNETMRRDAFETVGTLARYVDEQTRS